MNKKIAFVGLMILILLGYIFNIDKLISNLFLDTTSQARWNYSQNITSLKDSFNRYFNQIETIENYQKQKNKDLHYKILYENAQNELRFLKKDLELIDRNISHHTVYTKAVSYIQLNDFSKIILDRKLDSGKLYPLLTPEGFSAGVVKVQNGLSIGYLNPNPKANYAVFIGDSYIPGISAGGDEFGNVLIQYIPKWYEIKINDEVVTSGMDEVFPFGIKVGRVVGHKELLNTKMAIVRPYSSVISKKYFYILTKIVHPIQTIVDDSNNTQNKE